MREEIVKVKNMIRQAGLNPDAWEVRLESRQYLYLGNDRHETAIIDKAAGAIVERKGEQR